MTLNELRNLYRENLLVEAIIEPSIQEGAWVVEFRHMGGGFVLLTDVHGEECHYTRISTWHRSRQWRLASNKYALKTSRPIYCSIGFYFQKVIKHTFLFFLVIKRSG